MTETAAEPAGGNRTANSFRWKPGAALLSLGCLLEVIVWFYFSPDRTYQVFYSLPVVSGTVFFTVVWWLFASGLPWSTRITGILVLGLAAGLFRSQYRFKEFRGDMIPVFVPTSQPTDEERLNSYLDTVRNTPDSATDRVPVEAAASDPGASGIPELTVSPGDWPQFRGPDRNGVVRNLPAGVDWSEPPDEVWRHPVGKGWSSFAIADGLAFTQEQRKDRECVVCYDAMTGRQIWEHADSARFDEAMGGPGPRATPTIHNSRVYSLGATGQLNCLVARTGRRLWSRNILADAGGTNLRWAMSGSPLIVDDLVIVVPGGPDNHGIIAYDSGTGDIVWTNGSLTASYAAPMLATLEGTRCLLVFHGTGLSGHAVTDGATRFNIAWENDPKVNAAEPVVLSDHSVLIASGYGQGAARVDVRHKDGSWDADTVWTERRFKLKFNAAVQQGDHVYGLSEGILMCLQTADGKIAWKRGRYGYGQLLLAGDVLLIQAENGDIAVVAARPDRYRELARFPALDGKTWNHPALWNGCLLVRNGEEAACFRLVD